MSPNGRAMTEAVTQAIYEGVTPEVYRRNAFRLLGLSVEASMGEVQRRVHRLTLMVKYGQEQSPPSGVLSLSEPLTEDSVREAGYQLQDPVRRLLDEFFWFWPHGLGQTDDAAMAALCQNDPAKAVAMWQQLEANISEAGVSSHNLAIFYHCRALDLERSSGSRPLDAEEIVERDAYWAEGYRRWLQLLSQDGFWDRLKGRVREMNDRRLTPATAQDLRQTLPVGLLSINAQLALAAAERDDADSVQRHLRIMQASGMEHTVLEEAVGQVLAPKRKMVRVLCERAESESTSDPSGADGAIRRLIEDTQMALVALNHLLPSGSVIPGWVHDEVAATAERCLGMFLRVAVGRDAPDARAALRDRKGLLEIFELVSDVGPGSRARLAEPMGALRKAIRELEELALCWFCQKREGEEGSHAEGKLHKKVWQTGTTTQYQILTVKVPRCSECESVHRRTSAARNLGRFLGVAIGVVAAIATRAGFLVWLILGGSGFALGGYVGTLIEKRRSPSSGGTKSFRAWTSWPHVLEKIRDGYVIGTPRK